MSDAVPMCWTRLACPIGQLLLVGDGAGLSRVAFVHGTKRCEPDPAWRQDASRFTQPIEQLRAWFAGELRHFRLPLAVAGTDFQRTVWQALSLVPFGETITYRELAQRIGRPGASRAVGAANGANPLPIIVPCHRVIGTDGTLTGFAGGVPTKRWLLEHEARHAGPTGRRSSLPSDQLPLL